MGKLINWRFTTQAKCFAAIKVHCEVGSDIHGREQLEMATKAKNFATAVTVTCQGGVTFPQGRGNMFDLI